jgi:hypothetical protein
MYALTLIYIGFFALIGFACWVTESAWPLLMLLMIDFKTILNQFK